MTRIVAALDNSLAARPVIATALALGRLLGAGVDPLHVRRDGTAAARSAADAAGLPLRVVGGSVNERLIEAAAEEDVVAIVIGARGTPAARRPLGSTALAVASRALQAIVVVPPEALSRERLRKVLVPIEAHVSPLLTPRAIVELASGVEIDAAVLHVYDESSLPAFTDQPQHEHDAWAREFVRRWCPWGVDAVELVLRVGRADEVVPRTADELHVDLIALGWAQELAAGRAPVVRATLERASVPVMLVPVIVGAPSTLPAAV